ncbi:MAG: C-type lectin domain-containing protein [Deltaproteobacteria bacterium]
MNKLKKEEVLVAGRAACMASVLVVGALSCLPADDLSSYSNGTRPIEALPGDVPTEGPPGAPLANETALPPGGEAMADCGSECVAPALSIGTGPESTALGATSPSDGSESDQLSSSGDAGVPAPRADATASVPDAVTSRCVPGSIVGPDQRCFELVSAPSSWANARTRCQSNGAGWDLTTIHGETRNAWLASMLGSLTDAWVGASDTQSEGAWRWLGDSTPFWNGPGNTGSAAGNAYENWTDGTTPEPNGGATSDCLRLRAGGDWADFQCPTAYASICEGPQR